MLRLFDQRKPSNSIPEEVEQSTHSAAAITAANTVANAGSFVQQGSNTTSAAAAAGAMNPKILTFKDVAEHQQYWDFYRDADEILRSSKIDNELNSSSNSPKQRGGKHVNFRSDSNINISLSNSNSLVLGPVETEDPYAAHGSLLVNAHSQNNRQSTRTLLGPPISASSMDRMLFEGDSLHRYAPNEEQNAVELEMRKRYQQVQRECADNIGGVIVTHPAMVESLGKTQEAPIEDQYHHLDLPDGRIVYRKVKSIDNGDIGANHEEKYTASLHTYQLQPEYRQHIAPIASDDYKGEVKGNKLTVEVHEAVDESVLAATNSVTDEGLSIQEDSFTAETISSFRQTPIKASLKVGRFMAEMRRSFSDRLLRSTKQQVKSRKVMPQEVLVEPSSAVDSEAQFNRQKETFENDIEESAGAKARYRDLQSAYSAGYADGITSRSQKDESNVAVNDSSLVLIAKNSDSDKIGSKSDHISAAAEVEPSFSSLQEKQQGWGGQQSRFFKNADQVPYTELKFTTVMGDSTQQYNYISRAGRRNVRNRIQQQRQGQRCDGPGVGLINRAVELFQGAGVGSINASSRGKSALDEDPIGDGFIGPGSEAKRLQRAKSPSTGSNSNSATVGMQPIAGTVRMNLSECLVVDNEIDLPVLDILAHAEDDFTEIKDREIASTAVNEETKVNARSRINSTDGSKETSERHAVDFRILTPMTKENLHSYDRNAENERHSHHFHNHFYQYHLDQPSVHSIDSEAAEHPMRSSSQRERRRQKGASSLRSISEAKQADINAPVECSSAEVGLVRRPHGYRASAVFHYNDGSIEKARAAVEASKSAAAERDVKSFASAEGGVGQYELLNNTRIEAEHMQHVRNRVRASRRGSVSHRPDEQRYALAFEVDEHRVEQEQKLREYMMFGNNQASEGQDGLAESSGLNDEYEEKPGDYEYVYVGTGENLENVRLQRRPTQRKLSLMAQRRGSSYAAGSSDAERQGEQHQRRQSVLVLPQRESISMLADAVEIPSKTVAANSSNFFTEEALDDAALKQAAASAARQLYGHRHPQ